MEILYCKTENGQNENKLTQKKKKALHTNTYRKETEAKINKFVDDMDQFILGSKSFFEERENEDIEYNELTNNQNNEIYQFNSITNNEISKIESFFKQKKREAKEKYESKKKEFIQNVKNYFDKNYKSYSYSNKFLQKKKELDKKMEDCLIYTDFYNNYYLNENLQKDFLTYYKSSKHKREYEKLSKELEYLEKEDEMEYNRNKEKDFENIVNNFEKKYKKLLESLDVEKKNIIEEFKNQRMVELNDIKKRHFNQLQGLKKNFSQKRLNVKNNYHRQLKTLGFEQYINKKLYDDECEKYCTEGEMLNYV